jgi:hypothetical protein
MMEKWEKRPRQARLGTDEARPALHGYPDVVICRFVMPFKSMAVGVADLGLETVEVVAGTQEHVGFLYACAR